ncbi:hypothetical protein BD408DRAFT_190641 [Parasitella parasitica]|nr:hypothetical protein BD408DRAFT_190641 [Parasitella parasitica]
MIPRESFASVSSPLKYEFIFDLLFFALAGFVSICWTSCFKLPIKVWYRFPTKYCLNQFAVGSIWSAFNSW